MEDKTVWRISLLDIGSMVGDDIAESLTEHELSQIANAFSEGSSWDEVLSQAVAEVLANRDA